MTETTHRLKLAGTMRLFTISRRDLWRARRTADALQQSYSTRTREKHITHSKHFWYQFLSEPNDEKTRFQILSCVIQDLPFARRARTGHEIALSDEIARIGLLECLEAGAGVGAVAALIALIFPLLDLLFAQRKFWHLLCWQIPTDKMRADILFFLKANGSINNVFPMMNHENTLPLMHYMLQQRVGVSTITAMLALGDLRQSPVDAFGYTTLHVAAERGASLDLIRLLVDTDETALATRALSNRCIPLHLVLESMVSLQTVHLLVERFAPSLMMISSFGTALEIAINNQCSSEVLSYLYSHPAAASSLLMSVAGANKHDMALEQAMSLKYDFKILSDIMWRTAQSVQEGLDAIDTSSVMLNGKEVIIFTDADVLYVSALWIMLVEDSYSSESPRIKPSRLLDVACKAMAVSEQPCLLQELLEAFPYLKEHMSSLMRALAPSASSEVVAWIYSLNESVLQETDAQGSTPLHRAMNFKARARHGTISQMGGILTMMDLCGITNLVPDCEGSLPIHYLVSTVLYNSTAVDVVLTKIISTFPLCLMMENMLTKTPVRLAVARIVKGRGAELFDTLSKIMFSPGVYSPSLGRHVMRCIAVETRELAATEDGRYLAEMYAKTSVQALAALESFHGTDVKAFDSECQEQCKDVALMVQVWEESSHTVLPYIFADIKRGVQHMNDFFKRKQDSRGIGTEVHTKQALDRALHNPWHELDTMADDLRVHNRDLRYRSDLLVLENKGLRTHLGDLQQCCVCMDRDKSIVLMPCAHFCVCEGCAGEFVCGNLSPGAVC